MQFLDEMKAQIDEMTRVQKTMTLAAMLLTAAYKEKEHLHVDQFLDILKLSLETLTNTVQYEVKLELADKITGAASPKSLPPEVCAVILTAVDEVDFLDKHLKLEYERMGLMGEMLQDVEGKKETLQ